MIPLRTKLSKGKPKTSVINEKESPASSRLLLIFLSKSYFFFMDLDECHEEREKKPTNTNNFAKRTFLISFYTNMIWYI